MDTGGTLSDIINSLMQNPEVMKMVSSVAKETSEKKEDSPVKEEEEAPADFSIPPELLSKLPQMMSALSGLSSGTSLPHSEKRSDSSHSDGQRKELLRALKPFLSEKRCAVIDGLLQFEGLAGVLGTFQNK